VEAVAEQTISPERLGIEDLFALVLESRELLFHEPEGNVTPCIVHLHAVVLTELALQIGYRELQLRAAGMAGITDGPLH
jgi:hypothetical protein